MAVYFTLTPRIDPEHGPINLPTVDEGVCDLLGLLVNEREWAIGWYDYIGLRLALGHTREQIERSIMDDLKHYRNAGPEYAKELERSYQRLVVLLWLDTNYIVDNWFSG